MHFLFSLVKGSHIIEQFFDKFKLGIAVLTQKIVHALLFFRMKLVVGSEQLFPDRRQSKVYFFFVIVKLSFSYPTSLKQFIGDLGGIAFAYMNPFRDGRDIDRFLLSDACNGMQFRHVQAEAGTDVLSEILKV